MTNCLIVINSYHKDQMKTHLNNESAAELLGFKPYTLTRTRIPNVKNNFEVFNCTNHPKHNQPSKFYQTQIELVAQIIAKEIKFDRDFLKEGDFYFFGQNRLPKNLVQESRLIASRIVDIIEMINPTSIVPGHPDNWLSSAMFQIAKIYKIPTGFALETFYGSKKALIIDDFTYNNSSVNVGVVNPEKKLKLNLKIETPSILLENESFHLGLPTKTSENSKAFFWRIVKLEIKSLIEFSWRRKRKLKRWMLVDQVLPGVNSVRYFQRTLVAQFRQKRYFKNLHMPEAKNQRAKGIVFLHLAPEAAQLAFCRQYIDQIDFVRDLVQHYGKNTDIYIKEHPFQELGYRSKHFYRKLTLLTEGFIPTETKFSDVSKVPNLAFIATLHGTVAFHCAENRVRCILGSKDSFHKNLPFTEVLGVQQPENFIENSLSRNGSFSVAEMWASLEGDGAVIDYENDISGQLELARQLVSRLANVPQSASGSQHEGGKF